NMDKSIPRVFFTHDNYIGDYTGHTDSKADFYGKKVVLLVRDPRDVAVSQFFQWMYRMKPEKKLLNEYPPHGTELSIFDFVMHPGGGMPKVMDFMNLWAREMKNVKDICVIRYEDMRAEPEKTLARMAEFMGMGATNGQVREAVEYASYDNMKKMESQRSFWLGGARMLPGDKDNPNSYKVRRAKVGGYRDYFDDDEVRKIDALMRSELDPVFGYGDRFSDCK
ncbi:MAG: sulfotransferase domain-containing protein, partial [Marinobacter sp.]|uniref:sulfotransferase domain-containing protein n=1 Tax=Marinobacter sp. TaxID=50741 RepID=UPI0029C547D7